MSHHRSTDDVKRPRSTLVDAINVAHRRADQAGEKMVVYVDARGFWYVRPHGVPAPKREGMTLMARVVPSQQREGGNRSCTMIRSAVQTRA